MLHVCAEGKAEILYQDSPLKNELNASLFPPAVMESSSNESLNDTFISERQQ